MDGPIRCKSGKNSPQSNIQLWPLDRSFLPNRYFQQSYVYGGSDDFIRHRGKGYGVGKITDRTFSLFLVLFVLIALLTPIGLCLYQIYDEPAPKLTSIWLYFHTPPKTSPIYYMCVNGATLCFNVLATSIMYILYQKTYRNMKNETPRSSVIAVDFDGIIANTLSVKHDWILQNLGKSIPECECDRTSLRLHIDQDDYDRMFAEVFTRDVTLNRLTDMPGSLQAMTALKKMCQVVVMTARTGDALQAARQWLARHEETVGLEVLGFSEETISKGVMCETEHIGLLIDDDEGHIKSVTDKDVRGILLKVQIPAHSTTKGTETFVSWPKVLREVRKWLKETERHPLPLITAVPDYTESWIQD